MNLLKETGKAVLVSFLSMTSLELNAQTKVTIDWHQTVTTSKTTPTLQVVYNPMLNRNSPIHDGTFKALKELGADYVRFVPWFPYPHAAVAELKPPTKDSTFWNFSHVDPVMEDLMKATEGHTVIINFSTIPDWMFKTHKLVDYPADPNQVFWSYNEGTELRDTTLKEVTDYYTRLFSWYTKGGFTDELGKYHHSGYHYEIPYWEILNEVDFEHSMSPQLYTRIYDAVASALKEVSPHTQFVGMALGSEDNPAWFTYFLDHKNHTGGILPEWISYHFYGTLDSASQPIQDYQYSFFKQADNFLTKVRYIESIRKLLSPETRSDLDELGNILGDQQGKNIVPAYWNLSGAMYAYLYVELAKMGIDVAGESQLVGYPTQYPSVSMMDWETAKPNARYWVLKLIKDNFGPGDKLAATGINTGDVTAQAFITKKEEKLLLINKRNKKITVELPSGMRDGQIQFVDVSTGENPPAKKRLNNSRIILNPFSVMVVQFINQ